MEEDVSQDGRAFGGSRTARDMSPSKTLEEQKSGNFDLSDFLKKTGKNKLQVIKEQDENESRKNSVAVFGGAEERLET